MKVRFYIISLVIFLSNFSYAYAQPEGTLVEFQQIQSSPTEIAIVDGKINIHVTDMTAKDLLNIVFQKLHQKIIINNDIQGKVSVNIWDSTPEELLDIIVVNLGLSWKKENDTIIVTTKDKLLTNKSFFVKYAKLEDVRNALNVLECNSITVVFVN